MCPFGRPLGLGNWLDIDFSHMLDVTVLGLENTAEDLGVVPNVHVMDVWFSVLST